MVKNLLNVLQVEDSESDAALIIRLLRQAGYNVHDVCVDNAGDMAAALSSQPWDVIIADYSLPQFDAPAALALLQQIGLDIPFIVVSGTIGEEIAVAMMRAGAHDYIMKDKLLRLAPAVEREIREAHMRQERRQAEEKIRLALAEKEVLLREVHRRVKNNLQAIIALVEVRLEQVSDAPTQLLLKEFQEQARTMSLVYEQLYESDNLAQVDMRLYLESLATNVLAAFAENRTIDLRLEVEPMALDVSRAMPCGLIVNELLTNILKHAFPPTFTAPKCITIGLKTEDKKRVLWVSDNGAGLPPGLDWQQTQSLGLRLVNLWAAHQLGGNLEVDTGAGAGTTFKVTLVG